MIEINGRQFSGAVIKDDDSELIVSIVASDTIPDLCLAMDGAKSVTETTTGGSNVISVNTATHINQSGNGIYIVTFSKRLTVIEEMSKAIDDLLVMVLEGDGNV